MRTRLRGSFVGLGLALVAGCAGCAAGNAAGDGGTDRRVERRSDGTPPDVPGPDEGEPDRRSDSPVDRGPEASPDRRPDSLADRRPDATPGRCREVEDLLNASACPAGQSCGMASCSGGTSVFGCEEAGTGTSGSDCGTTPTDLCRPGLTCVTFEEGAETGICVAWCEDDAGCGGRMCVGPLTNGGEECDPAVMVCTPAPVDRCDVWAQTGCPTRQACYITLIGTRCDVEGSRPMGGTCDPEAATQECQDGGLCIADTAGGATGHCRRLCEAGVHDCPGGGRCTALRLEPYGICPIETPRDGGT